jgi:hypothetical protein
MRPMPPTTSRTGGDYDYLDAHRKSPKLRRAVNRIVRHIEDPRRRAFISRNITRFLATLEELPEEEQVSHEGY